MRGSQRSIAVVSLLLCVTLLAGCQGQQYWNLNINHAEIDTTDSGYEISGEVALENFPSGVIVNDTQLVLTTQNGNLIERIDIGQMNGNTDRRVVSFEEQLSQSPRCIFIRYGELKSPSNKKGGVVAYLVTKNGIDGLERSPTETFESCQVLIEEYNEIMKEG